MYDIRDIFRSIPIDREERRPIIGVVGEIYVRLHQFCNQEVVRQIEDLGGEAWVAPFSEWIHYQTNRYIANGKRDWKLFDIIAGTAFHSQQEKDEKKLLEPFRDDLLDWDEPTTKEVLDISEEYMDASFEGEAILSIGKAVDYAQKGCSGILNIIPFSCMPGMIVNAISKKVREQNGNIPWLNIDYDGMDENNGRSRLEAFIYQASQYSKKEKVEENVSSL
jgi:predicted nucleotide-binding protein (sugar kinase/HSP70/actin superfamily)